MVGTEPMERVGALTLKLGIPKAEGYVVQSLPGALGYMVLFPQAAPCLMVLAELFYKNDSDFFGILQMH